MLFGTCYGQDQTTTSVNDIKPRLVNLNIYPNPFQHNFQIESQDALITEVIVTDLLGDIVYQNESIYANELHLGEQFLTGVYLVMARLSTGEIRTYKIIKNT